MGSLNKLALLLIAFFIAEILLYTKGASVRKPEDIKSRTAEVTVGDGSCAYCTTSTCINTANEILKNMDDQVRPCDDFYHFACGRFLKNAIIPDEKSGINIFNTIRDEIEEQLRISVNKPISLNEPKAFKLVKNMYKSCINESAIEKQSLNPLRKVHVKLGGWPVVEGDRWNGSNFNWMDSIIKSRKIGYFDKLLKLRIGVDMKNSTKRVLDLDQAFLGLPREYLTKGVNDKIVKAYSSYMIDVAVMLGADRDRAEKELNDSLAFQLKLANISLPKEERRNATLLYNPMTIKELTIAYPSIPWKKYLNNFLPSTFQLDDNEVVIVNAPSYISDLEKLIEATDKRTQANYLMWRVAASSASYLSKDIRRRELEYTTVITGRKQLKERGIECIDIISEDLPIAVGAMYIREYFNENAKENAIEMVTNILNQFKQILEDIKWMDDETKKSALDKVASMTSHIAYPDELLDDSKLEEFYKNLEISENDYFNNILSLSKFSIQHESNKLREPYNKTEWIYHGRSAVVNAFYSSIENSIKFPAGILQGAFFSDDRPKYMNYGAIGFVIGHEITHGFDDEGRQFDKEGNLVDWWAPSTKEKYLEKAECIINQYGNYTVPEVEMNLNGFNTQGENIADNGGIKVAYLAYKAWSAVHSPEKRLPGLEKYSPSQMFWISAANTWCSKYRPEESKQRITTGFHSLPEFRIFGSFSNMPDFAEDFNCTDGFKMNPKNKCTVW